MNKELIDKVFKKLQEADVRVMSDDILDNTYVEVTPSCENVEELKWLPDLNLKQILKYSIPKKGMKIEDLRKEWGRQGFFKFKPYIEDDYYPSLVLRTNRFLHMFRGYHFQVSYTHNGIGEYESGIQRIEPLLKLCRDTIYEEFAAHSKYVALLWYSHLITVGSVIDSFRECLSDSQLLTKFLVDTLACMGVSLNYSWDELKGYVSYGVGNIPYDEYQTVWEYDKDKILFRLAFNEQKVQVEYMRNGKPHVLTLAIPDIFEGVTTSNYSEEELEEIREEVLELGGKYIGNIGTFTLLALSLAGFHANYMAMYSLEPRECLRPINSDNIVQVSKLEDIAFVM